MKLTIGNLIKMSTKGIVSKNIEDVKIIYDIHFLTDQLSLSATITKDTELPELNYIIGETTLFGKIINVGGRKPKAKIELFDGSLISCDAPENIVIELGKNLYKEVALKGNAKWDSSTLKVESFSITEIETIFDKEKDPIKELKEFSHYFNDIDPDQFVSSIRGEE